MESFLKDEGEKEIVLPRHRSPWFYLVLTMIVILFLALLTGAGYLVYRAAWGEEKGERNGGEVEDNSQHYMNSDIGFSISYPETWTLEEGYPKEGELISLKISLTSQKNLELTALQLDPVVTIGGIDGIKEFVFEDAEKRMSSLGGTPLDKSSSGTTSNQAESSQEETSPQNYLDTGTSAEGNTVTEDMFTNTKVGDQPALYTEFNANIMGEETRFFLFYIVADDYLFVLLGRAPAAEYKDVRPLLMAIAGSFKWEKSEETPTPAPPTISVK